MKLVRTVAVGKPAEAVFDYLADFTTTSEWDPGTVSTVRQSGDGGVGTIYLNTSRFLGRQTRLTYRVATRVDGRLIRLHGTNRTVHATDTIAVRPTGPSAAEVTYTAEFAFQGTARFAGPLLGPAVRRLVDRGAAGMREALERL